MPSSVVTPAARRWSNRRVGAGLLVLIGSAGPAAASDPHADQGTSRLSRAALIDRVLRYHPHPDAEARARTRRALNDYSAEQYAPRISDGCATSGAGPEAMPPKTVRLGTTD